MCMGLSVCHVLQFSDGIVIFVMECEYSGHATTRSTTRGLHSRINCCSELPRAGESSNNHPGDCREPVCEQGNCWHYSSWTFAIQQGLCTMGPKISHWRPELPANWCLLPAFTALPHRRKQLSARIVACDNIWCHFFVPATKQMIMEWRHSGSPRLTAQKKLVLQFEQGKWCSRVCLFFFLLEWLLDVGMVGNERYS